MPLRQRNSAAVAVVTQHYAIAEIQHGGHTDSRQPHIAGYADGETLPAATYDIRYGHSRRYRYIIVGH